HRAAGNGMGGSWPFDGDALLPRQDPNSPHARGNATTILDPRIPLDANHNPTDGRIDDDRFALTGGLARPLGGGTWSTTLAYTHTSRDTPRGFIRRDDISSDPD